MSRRRLGPYVGASSRRRLPLPARPDDRRTADDDGAAAAVVADREVPPVGQQRLLVGAEDPADVGGVVERGVEVDVVADRERQVQRGPRRAGSPAGRRPPRARRSRPGSRPRRPGPRAMKSLSVGRSSSRPDGGDVEHRVAVPDADARCAGADGVDAVRQVVEAEAVSGSGTGRLQQAEADQVVERLGRRCTSRTT